MNLFKALFGNSFLQQQKQNRQQRDNYACCDDIDVNIDLAEEIEDEMQNGGLISSEYEPDSYFYDEEDEQVDDYLSDVDDEFT